MLTTSRIMVSSVAMIIIHTCVTIPEQRPNRSLCESKSVLSASVAQMISPSLSRSPSHSPSYAFFSFRHQFHFFFILFPFGVSFLLILSLSLDHVPRLNSQMNRTQVLLFTI